MQNFGKMKKEPGDIIILHMRTTTYFTVTIIWCIVPEIMELCWDMDRNRENFFVILGYFCLFTPLTTRKTKILKNIKKMPDLEISSFYTCVPQMTIIWCMVPEIGTRWTKFFCHFGPFFPFYPPNNLENQNFEIMKKVLRDIIILHKFTKNHDHILYCSWDMVRANVIFVFHFRLFFSLLPP